jgi:Ser/Thr protein kinase RdoA (MazF antagonist)
MMNVQVMRYLVDRIVQGEMPDEVHQAVQRWQGTAPVHVRSSANHLFRFERQGKAYFLRLAHEQERSYLYIQAELDFVLHCAHTGLRVARPVLSANGTYIETVRLDTAVYHAVVFEGLQGSQYDSDDDLSEATYRAWGQGLARLHQASTSFPNHPIRGIWQETIQTLLKILPSEESKLAEVLQSGLAWLNTLPGEDYGLIHGDFELDNLVWEGEQLQALDFDAATYSWYGVDIAITLQEISMHDTPQTAWFLEGYAAVRSLPDRLRENVSRFWDLLLAVKMGRLLLAYANVYEQDCPKWLAEMRSRHEHWLASKRLLLKWD